MSMVTAAPSYQDLGGSDSAADAEIPDVPIFQSLARIWSANGRLVPGMDDQEWNAAQLHLILHGGSCSEPDSLTSDAG
jgi:hypothetical protein